MSAREIVEKALEKGKKKAKAKDSFVEYWYQHFGFSDDPFRIESRTWEEGPVSLLVDRHSELETLAELIGMTTELRQGFICVAVVGVDGVGKRTVVKTVCTLAREKSVEGYFLDIEDLQGSSPEPFELAGNRFPPFEYFRFAVFENVRPSRVSRVKSFVQYLRENARTPFVVIVILAPEMLGEVEADRELIIAPMTPPQICDVIESRIKFFGTSPNDVLSRDALSRLAECSLGIPHVALELASSAFKLADRMGKKQVDLGLVESSINRRKYLKVEELKLSSKDQAVLQYLLFNRIQETNPSDLSESMRMSHVMAWKYLERLCEKGLLEKEYVGRATRFYLNSFTKKQLQLMLFPRGGNES